MRRVSLVAAAAITLVVAAVSLALAGVQLQNRALDKCGATPPKLPKRLSHASGVSVDWTVPPFRYSCVYHLPGGNVERQAPP
jgi:hypothetical protein